MVRELSDVKYIHTYHKTYVEYVEDSDLRNQKAKQDPELGETGAASGKESA